jgi:hypothetical protein
VINLPRPACPPQDLFDGALVAGSVSDAVASGFRGPLRLTPAVSALKWAYQAMGISMPPGEGVADDAEDAGSTAEVRPLESLDCMQGFFPRFPRNLCAEAALQHNFAG